jgi:radical SAM protein with 4Fe4S-binding SPASM domain
MRYFLSEDAVLKWIEIPSVYHIKTDELYELDDESFEFLKNCSSETGGEAGENVFLDYCLNEGILTQESISYERPVPIKSPEPSLRYLELQITDKCNLKCRHCYIDRTGFSELPVRTVRDVLREFEEMQGLRVLITGGEPLTHGEFDELNRMLPEFRLRKVLFTNGLLLNKKTLKELKVDEIQISIDGLEEGHDSLRGKGAFRSTITAIRKAIDAGFEVSVATMIHPRNLGDFDEMGRVFKDMGIKDWTVDAPCIAGRLTDNAGLQISPDLAGKYLRHGYGSGLHAGSRDFACGLHLVAVMADGRISKCTFYADSPVGSIEDGLRECWGKIRPVRLDELACDCRHIESCRGGCRYRAQLLGSPLGKDLYRCGLYDILEQESGKT